MDIMDIASKGISVIAKGYGKKIKKKVTAPKIEDAQPVTITGDTYRCGFARAEIMPDITTGKTYYIAGHGSGHVMEGVLTPVYAHAIWLDCGEDKGIIWISADIVGLTNVEVQIVREKIKKAGIVPADTLINISCTHSHSGIDTIGYWGKPNLVSIPSNGKDPEYMEMLMNTMADIAGQAFKNKTAGKLFSGNVKVENGLFGKRKFDDRHEILSRLRFAPDDGSNETWIMNFGGHPNSLGGSNRMLSGEYPYFMRENIAEATGANVLYGIGPIGGMDMAQLNPIDKLDNVKQQAKMLSDAVVTIDNEHELTPEIKYLRQRFYYPVGNYVLILLAKRKVMSCNPYPYNGVDTGLALNTEMTYMTFGDQKILLLPGENFVTTVFGHYSDSETSATGKGGEVNPTPLAEICGDENLIAFGVSNDMTGYVVPPNDFILNKTQPYLNSGEDKFGDNHYHETNSMGFDSQRIIAETFTKVVKNFE